MHRSYKRYPFIIQLTNKFMYEVRIREQVLLKNDWAVIFKWWAKSGNKRNVEDFYIFSNKVLYLFDFVNLMRLSNKNLLFKTERRNIAITKLRKLDEVNLLNKFPHCVSVVSWLNFINKLNIKQQLAVKLVLPGNVHTIQTWT